MRIHVLGRVRIHGTIEVELARATEACLLAALAINLGIPMTVTALANHLWSQADQTGSSQQTVKDYLSNIRSTITQAGGDPYCLHNDRRTQTWRLTLDRIQVDYHQFRDLATTARQQRDRTLFEQALNLWPQQHHALANITKIRWAEHRRDELHAERRDVHLDLLDLKLASCEHTEVADTLAEMLDHITPIDRVLLLGATALARGGQHTAISAWTKRVTDRMQTTSERPPSPGALQHVDRLAADPHWTPPPSTQVVVPRRQLPPAPPHFVGRDDELTALTSAVDHATGEGGTVVISALAGAGGIGKTWLALHWAHTNLHRFPDGQLFVDLHGFSPTGAPVEPAVAVRGFLDALGIDPGRIPADLQAQASMYRSLVADERMVIVLDNAHDTDQVIPLLPGSPTCTVMITSRRHLAGLATTYGARLLDLDVLSDRDARDLLAHYLGPQRLAAEPEAVTELLKVCAGLPLAIRIVAARAEHHPEFPLAILAEELRDVSARLDGLDAGELRANLRAVLSWSVRTLSTQATIMFGLLGIAPGPDVSLSAAASLAALPVGRARAVLQELEAASLIQQHAPQRYRMHDLLRLYATDTAHQQIAEGVRELALQRVVDFYTYTAHTADQLLDADRTSIPLAPVVTSSHPLPDYSAALAWMGTHHAHLLAAQHTAAAHTWRATVWQLAWTLDTFHYRQGHRHDRLVVWRAALDAATHLPDPVTRIHAHRSLGFAYADLGWHEDAIGHLQQALTLAEHHQDLTQQAHTHHTFSWAWERRGNDRAALEHATRSLNLYRTLDQSVQEANALNQVGWFAARTGDYDTAREYCQAALTLHRRHNHPHGEAATLDSLGYIAHHTGDYRQALDYYHQALTLNRHHGNITHVAENLDTLGYLHTALGRHDQARTVWRESRQLYQEQGRYDDAARVQQQLDDLDHGDSSARPNKSGGPIG